MVTQNTALGCVAKDTRRVFVWSSENRRSGANNLEKNEEEHERKKWFYWTRPDGGVTS